MFLAVGVLLLIVFAVIFYAYRSRNVTYWEKRSVPTAKGCHWFFGHYKDILFSTKHSGLVFDDMYNEFPDAAFVGYYRMDFPGLLIKDPDLIKAVMQTEFNRFAKNEIQVDKKEDFLFGNNPFSQSGEEWKVARSHATPHFTNAKLKNYYQPLVKVADELVRFIRSRCDERGLVQFEAKELCGMFTTDAVANALCGVKNDTFNDRNSLFASLTQELFRSSTVENLKNMVVFLFPEISWLVGMRFASKRAEKLVLALTRQILSERVESKETIRGDIFQEIVNQRENGKADVFTDEYAASQMYACIVDGYATSSVAISYALFELAWHNDVQEKLRDEIKALLDQKQGNYTIDDVDGLKYLNMVLCESLRLHSPLPVMTKRCTIDYTVPSDLSPQLTIEKGTLVAIPIHSVHRDPKFYPEPLRFDPERFSDEAAAARHKFTYLPFGEGPRKCLGQRFAILQSKIAMMKIIEHFQIIPNAKSSYQLDVDPKVFLLKNALNGAWIHLKKLN